MGVALLENGSLIYSGVKVIKNRKSPHEILQTGRKIILQLIKDFQPRCLVVEKTFFAKSKNTALLNVFAEEITNIAKRKGLRVIAFAPTTMKRMICGNGHASKEEVAKAVVARFPELKVYLTQDRKWKAKFQYNMYDAVGLAIAMIQSSKN